VRTHSILLSHGAGKTHDGAPKATAVAASDAQSARVACAASPPAAESESLSSSEEEAYTSAGSESSLSLSEAEDAAEAAAFAPTPQRAARTRRSESLMPGSNRQRQAEKSWPHLVTCV